MRVCMHDVCMYVCMYARASEYAWNVVVAVAQQALTKIGR